jgi:hypothetical protein
MINPRPRVATASQASARTVQTRTVQTRTVQNWPIARLPGLSAQNLARLEQLGIQTTQQLLTKTKTPAQRHALAGRLETHIQHLNKWIALAELAQIPAVGCDYCGLLLHAGVCSVAQLATASPPRIHRQILKLQVAMMQRPDLCPSVDQVAQWIEQAQRISR